MKFKYLKEEQEFTSKDTALDQIPATYKQFDFTGDCILDYGCGRGLAKNYCAKAFKDCVVYNFDPYWHFDEIREFERDPNPKKVITCNNVLNVIKGDLKSAILDKIYRIAKKNNAYQVIFKIYEKDGTGIGVQTGKDKYQRNQKTAEYIPVVKSVFKDYRDTKRGQYIILEK